MFSRISRYLNVPNVVVDDANGRLLASKSLRLLPEVSGTFQHIVEDGDRLDHLAFKYYQQPQKWWRICDANPLFLSPLDLLGQGPVLTVRFTLGLSGGGQPPWAALAKDLIVEPGVERFRFIDEVRIAPEPRTIDGQEVTLNVEHHELVAVIIYNQRVTSSDDLRQRISESGFSVAQPQAIGRVGKRITVPPDVVD